MDNPFSYIKNQQEARAKRLQQEKEAKAQKDKIEAEAKALIEKVRWESRQAYDEMVTTLLTQLRDMAYPNHHVRGWTICLITPRTHVSGGGYGIPEFRSESEDISTVVSVELEFNSKSQPVSFICKCGNSALRAKLTRDDLIKILKTLHPPKNY